MNARNRTLTAADALELARSVAEIHAVKGKSVVHIVLRKDQPDAARLKSLLLGPTKNLRAPVLRVGKTLIVGFDEGMYRQLLLS